MPQNTTLPPPDPTTVPAAKPGMAPAPPPDRFLGRPPAWIDLFDPRQPEAFLAFCSLWCATQMWVWPAQFDAANGLLTRQIGLFGHERTWATIGLVAAVLKLTGLASRLTPRWAGFAPGLRMSGLFLSIVFWLIVGISTMVDLPHTILPIALTGLGVAAAFELGKNGDSRETWR